MLRGLRFLCSLVWPLSLLLICVTTSWTSCKVSRFLLLSQFPWGRSQSVLPPPGGELPLPAKYPVPAVNVEFSDSCCMKTSAFKKFAFKWSLLNIERGNIYGAVYLDLTKAFDTVDHEILMSKLSSVGVSPRSLQWFSSYLSNQKQPKPLVRINYPKLFPLLSGFRKEAS